MQDCKREINNLLFCPCVAHLLCDITVDMDEFLEFTGMDEKAAQRWWPKMLKSGFVESLNPKVEYVFALRFPNC